MRQTRREKESERELSWEMDEFAPEPLKDHPRFTKIDDLGSGTFGMVVLARDKVTDGLVAIKFLPRGPKINHYAEREILNHRRLLHHHVIQFKGVLITEEFLGIVLEYADGGDLLSWIKERNGLDESLGRWFFQQLIMGLDYVHQKGVVNRDIKLENTLVGAGERPMLKICDFGYSKNVNFSMAKTKVGTASYLAPEVLGGDNGDTYDGVKADIWAAGVFAYTMLLGTPPFNQPDETGKAPGLQVVFNRIVTADFHIPEGSLSKECEDLIRKILVIDPKQRLTIQEIQNHPWYLDSLPEGALEFNAQCLEASAEVENEQALEEILSILEEARKP